VLCYVVLSCVTLCCLVLCYVVSCCLILCCALLCYVVVLEKDSTLYYSISETQKRMRTADSKHVLHSYDTIHYELLIIINVIF
jgi:hypothetical protein